MQGLPWRYRMRDLTGTYNAYCEMEAKQPSPVLDNCSFIGAGWYSLICSKTGAQEAHVHVIISELGSPQPERKQ